MSGDAGIAGGGIAAAEHRVALRFDRVCFAYHEGIVLQDASFHLHRGEFAVLVGANGAGKTTILRLILGLNRPSGGSIEVLGMSPDLARLSVGYVPQQAQYDPAFPISVAEVVGMGLLRGMGRAVGNAHKDAVARALELADLGGLAARPYASLSGGQRRRVLVARALAPHPDFLILDEPTANLDAESGERLYRALGKLKGRSTVLVVTHDSQFVSELTDVVLCVGVSGEHPGGKAVVRHAVSPSTEPTPGLFGGKGLRVMHGTDLPDAFRCPSGCRDGDCLRADAAERLRR